LLIIEKPSCLEDFFSALNPYHGFQPFVTFVSPQKQSNMNKGTHFAGQLYLLYNETGW